MAKTMAQRAPTQREIKAAAKAEKGGPMVTIYNPGTQMVPIRLKPPAGGDFFLHEQSIYVRGKKTAQLSARRVDWNQLDNLQKKGVIKLVGQLPERE